MKDDGLKLRDIDIGVNMIIGVRVVVPSPELAGYPDDDE
jgi:hypothetical protein